MRPTRLITPLILAVSGLLSLPAAAQSATLPILEAADRAFLQAFNQADRASLTAYAQAHFSVAALATRSAEVRVDDWLNAHQILGNLQAVEVSGVSRITIVSAASGRAPQDADIVLLHDTEQPDRLSDLWIHPVNPELAAIQP